MNVLCTVHALLLGQADAATSSVAIESVLDFVIKGGKMMVPIGACSLVAVAVIVERLISSRRQAIVPAGWWPGLEKILTGDGDVPARALKYCERDPQPTARVLSAGIRKLEHGAEAVEKALRETGQREVGRMRKFVRLLAVIASVSPLMGLLGTIFGLIQAFQTVALSADAMGKTELLAAGIYEAMITTAAGLLVAIPVLLAYHWINARIETRTLEMDDIATQFLDLVSRRAWNAPAVPRAEIVPQDVDAEEAVVDAVSGMAHDGAARPSAAAAG